MNRVTTMAALLLGASLLGSLPAGGELAGYGDAKCGAECACALAAEAVEGGCRDLPGRKPPCPRSEDDPGFGGTHVTCYYACARFDGLTIHVRAEDPDADVSGYTDCGGTRAECPRLPRTCAGVSEGLARYDDTEQGCVADSHEFYSSRVTVVCAALARGLFCRLTGVSCPGLDALSAVGVCIRQNPSAAAQDIERLVAAVAEPDATSFVAFEVLGAGSSLSGFVVRYDGGEEPSCWAGPL